jgi:hypothetical protein
VFPPKTDETLSLEKGTALLAVKVAGTAGPDGTERQGVRIAVTGGELVGAVPPTNSKGCTLVQVRPNPAGTVYKVQLLGGPSGAWVSPDGADQPAEDTDLIEPNKSFVHTMSYDQAARLEVTVAGAGESEFVTLEPSEGTLGKPLQQPLDAGGTATFENIYPGIYTARLAGATESVDLSPGANQSLKLVVES